MSDKGTANPEAAAWQQEAEKLQQEVEKLQQEAATLFNWADLLPIGLVLLILFGAFGFLMWHKPDKFTTIRINLLWVSTLVAILTLSFGHQLIALLKAPKGDTKTIEIVLSSLVGFGIGGLIALAGQLVQDFDEKSTKTEPSAQDSGEKPAEAGPPAQDSDKKSAKAGSPANGQENVEG